MKTIQSFVDNGINSLKDLQDALYLAMQLEFSTIPPYLCAEWSINKDTSGVRALIGSIVKQEMKHFALAGDILYAIGGTAENYDILNPLFLATYPAKELPGGVLQKLLVDTLPLSPQQVEVFMQIEHPLKPVALPNMEGGGKTYANIAEFYKAIIDGINSVKPTFVNAYNIEKKITSSEVAIDAIHQIMDEGEGTEVNPYQPDGKTFAHYYSFKEIHVGRKLVEKPKGSWVWEGDEVNFPTIFPFTTDNRVSPTEKDKEFIKKFEELMKAIRYYWTTKLEEGDGFYNTYEIMNALADKGREIIEAGNCPIFKYP
jgi:hypothetical protein